MDPVPVPLGRFRSNTSLNVERLVDPTLDEGELSRIKELFRKMLRGLHSLYTDLVLLEVQDLHRPSQFY